MIEMDNPHLGPKQVLVGSWQQKAPIEMVGSCNQAKKGSGPEVPATAMTKAPK
jgi:hypothetical protein